MLECNALPLKNTNNVKLYITFAMPYNSFFERISCFVLLVGPPSDVGVPSYKFGGPLLCGAPCGVGAPSDVGGPLWCWGPPLIWGPLCKCTARTGVNKALLTEIVLLSWSLFSLLYSSTFSIFIFFSFFHSFWCPLEGWCPRLQLFQPIQLIRPCAGCPSSPPPMKSTCV